MGALCDMLTKRFDLKSPPQWFVEYIGGGPSSAGVTVSATTALKYTPFWAGVRIISGTIASLPFMVYRRRIDGGKDKHADHPIYQLLHNRPNKYMDAVTFMETRQGHVLTYGNGYAEIQRDGSGRPIALWPLLPNKTRRRATDEGILYYEVQLPSGGTVKLPDDNVLHIKGLGFDGFTGYDVISYHKDAIGYGIAVKEFGARFFANGASPGGVAEHPESLSEEAQTRLRKQLERMHQGLSQSHRLMILEEGMKWHQTGVDPEKAQAIEAQKFTVDDCSRIFNIPPHKLGSLDKATFSNIEEQNIDFLTTTMLYWFRKWEQECNYKLFMPSEQKAGLFCEILVSGLLRGNVAARSSSYAMGRQWGYYSINDIRAMENLNSIGPAGDIYLDPLNMVPAGSGDQNNHGGSSNEDNVREALRGLIAAQCRRIIVKQNKALDKPSKEGFWPIHRQWARDVLVDAAQAWGASMSLPADIIEERLTEFILATFNHHRTLNGDEFCLADELMEQIGGSYALRK